MMNVNIDRKVKDIIKDIPRYKKVETKVNFYNESTLTYTFTPSFDKSYQGNLLVNANYGYNKRIWNRLQREVKKYYLKEFFNSSKFFSEKRLDFQHVLLEVLKERVENENTAKITRENYFNLLNAYKELDGLRDNAYAISNISPSYSLYPDKLRKGYYKVEEFKRGDDDVLRIIFITPILSQQDDGTRLLKNLFSKKGKDLSFYEDRALLKLIEGGVVTSICELYVVDYVRVDNSFRERLTFLPDYFTIAKFILTNEISIKLEKEFYDILEDDN